MYDVLYKYYVIKMKKYVGNLLFYTSGVSLTFGLPCINTKKKKNSKIFTPYVTYSFVLKQSLKTLN